MEPETFRKIKWLAINGMMVTKSLDETWLFHHVSIHFKLVIWSFRKSWKKNTTTAFTSKKSKGEKTVI